MDAVDSYGDSKRESDLDEDHAFSVDDDGDDDIECFRRKSQENDSECDSPFIVDLITREELVKNEGDLEEGSINSNGTVELDEDMQMGAYGQMPEYHNKEDMTVTSEEKRFEIAEDPASDVCQLSSDQGKVEQHYYITLGANGSDYTMLTRLDNTDSPKAVMERIRPMERWINEARSTEAMEPVNKNSETQDNSFPCEPPYNTFEVINYDADQTSKPSCNQTGTHQHLSNLASSSTPPLPSSTAETSYRSTIMSALHCAQQTESNQEAFDLGLMDSDCLTSTPTLWTPTNRRSQTTLTDTTISSSYTLSTNSSMTDIDSMNSPEDHANNLSAKFPRVPNNTPSSDFVLTPHQPPPAFAQFHEPLIHDGSFVKPHKPVSALAKLSHNEKERRRRNRLNNACSALRELVPGITERTDKATLLEFSARYIFQLKQNAKLSDKEFVQLMSTP